jgi:hypothetical protein
VSHHNSRARQKSPRPSQARARRVANLANQDDAPASDAAQTFSVSIEALSLTTESLPALARDWLARGIQAIAQAVALAVKQQLAQLAAPPVHQLPPPQGSDATAGRAPDVAEDVARRPRRPR